MTTQPTNGDELRKWLIDNYFFFEHLDCFMGSDCAHRTHADDKLNELMQLIAQEKLVLLEDFLILESDYLSSGHTFDFGKAIKNRIAAIKQEMEGK